MSRTVRLSSAAMREASAACFFYYFFILLLLLLYFLFGEKKGEKWLSFFFGDRLFVVSIKTKKKTLVYFLTHRHDFARRTLGLKSRCRRR